MKIYINFLANETTKGLIIRVDEKYYIFNMFGGFQRISNQNGFHISKPSAIFLSNRYSLFGFFGYYCTYFKHKDHSGLKIFTEDIYSAKMLGVENCISSLNKSILDSDQCLKAFQCEKCIKKDEKIEIKDLKGIKKDFKGLKGVKKGIKKDLNGDKEYLNGDGKDFKDFKDLRNNILNENFDKILCRSCHSVNKIKSEINKEGFVNNNNNNNSLKSEIIEEGIVNKNNYNYNKNKNNNNNNILESIINDFKDEYISVKILSGGVNKDSDDTKDYLITFCEYYGSLITDLIPEVIPKSQYKYLKNKETIIIDGIKYCGADYCKENVKLPKILIIFSEDNIIKFKELEKFINKDTIIFVSSLMAAMYFNTKNTYFIKNQNMEFIKFINLQKHLNEFDERYLMPYNFKLDKKEEGLNALEGICCNFKEIELNIKMEFDKVKGFYLTGETIISGEDKKKNILEEDKKKNILEEDKKNIISEEDKKKNISQEDKKKIISEEEKKKIIQNNYFCKNGVFYHLDGSIMCKKSSFSSNSNNLLFLGTGGSIPSLTRNVSSIIYERDSEVMLLDVGEDTIGQIYRVYGNYDILKRLKIIFLSHSHADHILGILDVLKKFNELTNNGSLVIICPQITLSFIQQFKKNNYKIFDSLELIESGASPLIIGNFTIYLKKCLTHAYDSVYLMFEHNRFKVSYSGDTRPSKTFSQLSRNVDVMIHECTYTHEFVEDAISHTHSTMLEAIEIYKESCAKNLILTHFSQKISFNELYIDLKKYQYEDEKLWNIDIANDFFRYQI